MENNITIWAFNDPSADDRRQFVHKSIANEGLSRFGWSYEDRFNLHKLEAMSWEELEQNDLRGIYIALKFLWNIRPEDWIVHIHVPERGRCTAVQATGTYTEKSGIYTFTKQTEVGDFRHAISVDKKTAFTFDRNDPNVSPILGRGLRPRSKYERIVHPEHRNYESLVKAFFTTRENLKKGKYDGMDVADTALLSLQKGISEPLWSITQKIHENHPRKKLEKFFEKIFRVIPGVLDVEARGSGSADKGADLVITHTLPIFGFQEEYTLAVQIKSFEGEHWSTDAVDQVVKGMAYHGADRGMIISTAQASNQLRDYINKKAEEIKKPITLLAGIDVAKFVLRHHPDLVSNSF